MMVTLSESRHASLGELVTKEGTGDASGRKDPVQSSQQQSPSLFFWYLEKNLGLCQIFRFWRSFSCESPAHHITIHGTTIIAQVHFKLHNHRKDGLTSSLPRLACVDPFCPQLEPCLLYQTLLWAQLAAASSNAGVPQAGMLEAHTHSHTVNYTISCNRVVIFTSSALALRLSDNRH